MKEKALRPVCGFLAGCEDSLRQHAVIGTRGTGCWSLTRQTRGEALRARRDSGLFSPVEGDALESVERMTITGEKVTDEIWARLRRHFTESRLVELTAAAGLENFRSQFNVPLAIESHGFCVLP